MPEEKDTGAETGVDRAARELPAGEDAEEDLEEEGAGEPSPAGREAAAGVSEAAVIPGPGGAGTEAGCGWERGTVAACLATSVP